MSPRQLRKLKIAAVWFAIGVAGVMAGWWNYGSRETELRELLARGAMRATVAFDTDDLSRFAGTAADAQLPGYAAIRSRLQKFKALDPRVRSIYLFRALPGAGKALVLADSAEQPGEAGATSGGPGPRPPLAADWEATQRSGRSEVFGPRRDEAGGWLAAYATLGPAAPGAPRHFLGLEVDADGWSAPLWTAAAQGALYVWVLLGLPVTAWLVTRRQHEQREVIRNLSEAMEQSHSAIMILDLEGRIEYANRGLCQQVGYARRDLIGREWQELYVPQPGQPLLSDVVATVRAGRPWEGDWLNRRKDGSLYPVHGVATPVKDRADTLSCVVAVFDDVSEIKAREAELREARDAALAGDRAKGQFLATMSHEVRTPLNGIVGFTSLLLETPLTTEQREYVQTIRMSTEALIQLTGDILDFARIESGKLKLDPMACDPRECVEDALDLLAAKAAERNLELLHRVQADVPAAVLADGGRLRQVLVNLIGNAVKFTERGEVEVTLGLGPPATPAPAASGPPPVQAGAGEACVLEFSIRDTGIGIAPEHHAKLFRPFTQVDESTTRRYGGTGLGLAISRNLVELMGGTIRMTSEPTKGSTFAFNITVEVAAAPPPRHNLKGMRVGLGLRSNALRGELADLIRGWHGEVIEAEAPADLAGSAWDMALVEACPEMARDLAAPNASLALPAEKTLGLVPISLANDVRTTLRGHFRLLVNKPVHHDALYGLLSGSRPDLPSSPPASNFGLRVLVVEDNPTNQRLAQRVLGSVGCTSAVADNGRRALAELTERADDFDLVLLDLHMPEMDGIEVLREIRAGNAGAGAKGIYVIALTADARGQQRARAMAAGLNDYLTKPLIVSELDAALRRYLSEAAERQS